MAALSQLLLVQIAIKLFQGPIVIKLSFAANTYQKCLVDLSKKVLIFIDFYKVDQGFQKSIFVLFTPFENNSSHIFLTNSLLPFYHLSRHKCCVTLKMYFFFLTAVLQNHVE